MNDPRFLRVPTIFETHGAGGRPHPLRDRQGQAARAARRRRAERRSARPSRSPPRRRTSSACPGSAARPSPTIVGRKNPGIYDWDISHYAMEMGLALHERLGARLLYVSLTDYVQHKEAPRGPMADRFYARFDELLGDYLDAGFVCGITADHGMNDKTRARRLARRALPGGPPRRGGPRGLPRDPADHRSLRRAPRRARLLRDGVPRARPHRARSRDRSRACPGSSGCSGATRRPRASPCRRTASAIWSCSATARTVLGKSRGASTISRRVQRGLRSHGGLHEQAVPVVVTHALGPGAVEGRRAHERRRLRSGA